MEVIKKYLFHKPLLTKGSAVFILALLFFGVSVPSGFADAGIFGSIINFAAGSFTALPAFIFLFALQLILTLSSVLALAAGLLLEGVISMPIFFTKCPGASPCFIDTAWGLMRDIVNMLLIVILVVIAFATMLRKQELGATKALIPLIAVAILVNFSRVIVGVVVDVSSLVMGVFLPQITGISALTDSLAAQKDIIMDQLGANSFKISEQVLAIFKTLTLIIFQLAYAFILVLYAVIFLVRFVALWLLTIFSPIAFVAFILPITRKKIFDEWRNQLISWSFMGVSAVFFLWLGKLFSQSIGSYKDTFSSGDVFNQSTALGDFLLEIFPYIFLLIFLYVTFMLALKTNAVGAGMIINAAKKAGGVAGIATGKFAGRMAQRGAMVGGRAAERKLVRPGLRKIAPKIPIVKQWQPGYSKGQYEKMRKTALKGGRNSKEEKRFLDMQKKAGLINVSKNASWDALNDTQKNKVQNNMRSKAAGGAARLLGGGAKKAKQLIGTAGSALTPEERKALAQWGIFGKLKGAKKSDIQKSMGKFEDYSEKDLRTTSKHTRSSPSDKQAAEILLLKKHGEAKDEQGNPRMNSEKKIEIGKKARAAGLGSEVDGSLNDAELDEVYDKDTPERSGAEGRQTAMAAKAVEEDLKNIGNLSETAAQSLLETATNIHTKIAAIRKLSSDNVLDPNDFKKMEESLKSFGQINNVLKHSLQFADPTKISEIMEKMSPQDHRQIDPRIFDSGFEQQLNAWFKGLTVDAYKQVMKSAVLKSKLAGNIRGGGLNLSQNPEVNTYHDDEVKRGRPFNTIL